MIIKAPSALKFFGSGRKLFFFITKSNSESIYLWIPLLHQLINQSNHSFSNTSFLCYFPILIYSLGRPLKFLPLVGLTLSIQSYLSFLMRKEIVKSYQATSQKFYWEPKMNAGTRQRRDIRVDLGEVQKLGNKMS